MKERQIKKWFLPVMLLFLVSAASVLLVPFAITDDGDLSAPGYAAGIMFWSGLILGTAGYIVLSKKADIHMEKRGRIPPGLRFFSNPPAKAADAVLFAALAGSIYCAANIAVNQIIAVIFLLFLLIGIYAHFLLNGRVYRHIWNHAAKKASKKKVEGEERDYEK